MPSFSISHILFVGCGGFIGAVLRYIISSTVDSRFAPTVLPFGTLSVNLIGCFLLGLIGGLIQAHQLFSPSVRVFLTIGVLGGFTTYSTFAFESLTLLMAGSWLRSAIYVSLHVFLGISAAGLGYALCRCF